MFRTTDAQPVVAADGTTMAWMLDSLSVTLTARGAELAARCLLAELAKFEATQIATYGLTAVPLLNACIAASGGRYTGVLVRKEPKAYGARKLLEGPFDPARPVVILDDSIASGSSTAKCIEALEQAGARVEGACVLVRFGYGRGWAHMLARGLRMEKVFDVFTDLCPVVDPARVAAANPSDRIPAVTWGAPAPDGLHPTALARRVMEAYYAGGPIPRAPAHVDGDLDASGGAWVSARSRANVHERFARNGYWVLPGEPRPSTGEAVVKAALRTATQMTADQLGASALAVTGFGALEPCTVGEIDNERYGILVRGAERPEQMGGALPRMPSLFRDWPQFDHARTRNAQLLPFEPYLLYRHEVAKVVEPGAAWQPDGVPAGPPRRWEVHGPRIAERALALVRAAIARNAASGGAARPDESPATGEPLPHELIGGDVSAIYVCAYRAGKILGCQGGQPTSLDETLALIAEKVIADPRFAANAGATGELAVTVSLLDRPQAYGDHAPATAVTQVDHGRQALLVQQNARMALLLPFVTLQHSLTQAQFAAELVDKAGITRAPYAWTRFDVHTYYADATRSCALRGGLPPGDAPPTIAAAVEHLLPRMLGYLRAHQRPDGLRDGFYRPLADHVHGELERPRQVHGVWALAAAHRALGGDELGARVTASIAAADKPDLALHEAAMLLLALCEHDLGDARIEALAARIAGAIDGFGTVSKDAVPAQSSLDFLLPQLALALARVPSPSPTVAAAGDRVFARAARRFDVMPAWAYVPWLPQAAAARYRRTPAAARIAFAAADWALAAQQPGGAFINGEQLDGPGCTTAVYLEGIAAALELAVAAGDTDRAARYRDACLRGLQFVDELTYQERDRGMLPAPERAYGGLRLSRSAGDVRIDFVQHAVLALLRLRGLTGS